MTPETKSQAPRGSEKEKVGTVKVVINDDFGGFGLSQEAYEKLIEWGVPVYDYVEQERNPATGLYDRSDSPQGEFIYRGGINIFGPLWDVWTRDAENRTHPLIVRVVEELGANASGPVASLKVVEIPEGVEFEIDEYDGLESIHETHRSWS